jgi:hypothetical protein
VNALFPIVVTDDGIVRAPVNPEQPENTLSPIVVTDDGIVKGPVNPEQR